MSAPQTIQLGNSPIAPYVAFGDDSQFRDYAAFAFVLIPRTRLRFAERKLERLKARFAIPASVTIHCSPLFSGQKREKAGLGHLSPVDVREVVSQAVTLINDVNGRVHYGVDHAPSFFQKLGTSVQFHDHTGGSPFTKPVSADPKALLGMLAVACFPTGQRSPYGPTAAQCEVFVSEDKTKLAFIGDRRLRADSLYSGFYDMGNVAGQLNAKIVAADVMPLMQLADIAAYLCSHAAGTTPDESDFWVKQRDRIRHWFRVG